MNLDPNLNGEKIKGTTLLFVNKLEQNGISVDKIDFLKISDKT